MGNYDLGKLKELGGEGVSGLASRSDAARARELSKYDLTLAWFDQKVEEQNNLCADCGKQEKARLGNGKRKPLGLGFLDGQPNRLICTNCAAKQRKIRMEEKNAPKDYTSFEEFWAENCWQEKDVELLKKLRARHAEVSELYAAVCDYVRGTDNCPEGLQDTLDEVEQELREFGTTDFDMLACPFCKVEHRNVYDAIQEAAQMCGAPQQNAVFAKYGLVTALPSHSTGTNYVRVFLKQNGRYEFPDWGPASNPIRTIRCSTFQCKGEFVYDQDDRVPGWYFSEPTNAVVPPSTWHCPACEAAQAARKPKGRTLAEVAADRIYTVQGEWRTPVDNPNTAWFAKLPGES